MSKDILFPPKLVDSKTSSNYKNLKVIVHTVVLTDDFEQLSMGLP